MKTIYKYELEITDEQSFRLPRNSRILSAGNQLGRLFIWAEVDTDIESELRTFHIYGTGNPIPELNEGARHKSFRGRIFIGTVQMGVFAWHVYEIVEQ
jgi:hypothetical protein